MTYTLRVSDAAQSDLAEIARWYESKDALLAANFETQAKAVFGLLMQHPRAFAVIRKRVRKINLHHFPYSVFYEMKRNDILVLAILHSSRYPRFGHH
jgi:plasmid stabilization system protein ParE